MQFKLISTAKGMTSANAANTVQWLHPYVRE